MTMKCPNCGNEIEIPEGVVEGQHVQCPHCGTKFEFHAPQQKKKISKALWTLYAVRIFALLCCLISAYQFLDGWINLPSFDRGTYGVSVSQGDANIAMISLAKMFAGFFFAKVSRAFWRMTK